MSQAKDSKHLSKAIIALATAALVIWLGLSVAPVQAQDPGNCEVAYSPEIGRCETPDSLPKPPPTEPDSPDTDSGQRIQGWATATIHDPTTTPQRIATSLGLPEGRPIWEWGTQNQTWIPHFPDATNSLPAGIAIAYKGGYTSTQAQTEAGIGPTNLTISLYNGWNIITAPHTSFLLDNSLIDCAAEQGAIAVLRYDSQTSALTATLTCQPQQRPMGLEPITQINPGDTIYIYYRTLLPVVIRYDSEQRTYAP